MYQLIITGPGYYYDSVSCESWDEVMDTFLVNFYDAEGLSILKSEDIIPDLLLRGYSISISIEEVDGAPCCPVHSTDHKNCDFPGYADNH